ncbi:hypothetical protein AVEN_139705-1 [Araneus ventricosus]|uniref:Uncharacterized protein n=1 Tax=Araneus ventricosus TaxID=182803 RepID=A0A4Y2I892_ARAVE|nr:hypothetical protein AVEN_102247-1 [Araneus ventricosus]GBM73922.1 hypothetical protein AVEN_238053-1 [Araneus ventricosus]GBM74028.1 hypothetical protein AVEN_124731-1 [Araneus ventricosus]GBM74041.1 hypothetical protein AVEN_139705-1 [Araneus ventricosus]
MTGLFLGGCRKSELRSDDEDEVAKKRQFYRGSTGSQANELRPWRQNETSRKFLNCGLISTRNGKYQELSRDCYVTSRPVGKSIKASSQTKSELVGVWSAVKLVN